MTCICERGYGSERTHILHSTIEQWTEPDVSLEEVERGLGYEGEALDVDGIFST